MRCGRKRGGASARKKQEGELGKRTCIAVVTLPLGPITAMDAVAEAFSGSTPPAFLSSVMPCSAADRASACDSAVHQTAVV